MIRLVCRLCVGYESIESVIRYTEVPNMPALEEVGRIDLSKTFIFELPSNWIIHEYDDGSYGVFCCNGCRDKAVAPQSPKIIHALRN